MKRYKAGESLVYIVKKPDGIYYELTGEPGIKHGMFETITAALEHAAVKGVRYQYQDGKPKAIPEYIRARARKKIKKLETALDEAKIEIKEGNYNTESVDDHIKRVVAGEYRSGWEKMLRQAVDDGSMDALIPDVLPGDVWENN
jgi:hypothetical protein